MNSVNAIAVNSPAIVINNRAALYTTSDEFCAIFNREMQSYFSLALVLTGDEANAQKSFLAGLAKCRKSTTVFKDWASSYARLAVIESAIELMAPTTGRKVRSTVSVAKDASRPELDVLLRLDVFERFVFVLTVLERFTVQDCAIVLKCSQREVEQARLRAFDFIAANEGPEYTPAQTVGHRLAS
jgi:hypothetical protein